jgi:hypothetical protein
VKLKTCRVTWINTMAADGMECPLSVGIVGIVGSVSIVGVVGSVSFVGFVGSVSIVGVVVSVSFVGIVDIMGRIEGIGSVCLQRNISLEQSKVGEEW